MLSPYGTLYSTSSDEWERFRRALRPGCDELDLGEEGLTLACELIPLAGLEGPAHREAREALLLLLLLLLAAQRQGSTRLPLLAQDAAARAWLGLHTAALLNQTPEGEAKSDAAEHGWRTDTALEAMRNLVREQRTPLINAPDANGAPQSVIVVDGEAVYSHRLRHIEQSLINQITLLAGRPLFTLNRADLREALRTVCESEGTKPRKPAMTEAGETEEFDLTPAQKYALLAAARYPFTVVSGGPGTGKTTVVVSMMRMLIRLGVSPDEILLAAPTGKAAYRLGESVDRSLDAMKSEADVILRTQRREPMTLHRLLGYSPATDRFRHHAGNRLPGKVIIVDEASMIDLFLMAGLLAAVPDDARLILIGDADQLPSVDAGAVLRDLIGGGERTYASDLAALPAVPYKPAHALPVDVPTEGLAAVILDEPHRAEDDRINLLADAIRAPEDHPARIDDLFAASVTASDASFRGIEWVATDDRARDSSRRQEQVLLSLLRRWYTTFIGTGAYLDALETTYSFDGDGCPLTGEKAFPLLFGATGSARLLCLTRGRDTGVEAVNRIMHGLHRQILKAPESARFLPGEPVIMLENDYENQVFNGDQGVILWVADAESKRHPMAVFPRTEGRYALLHIDALRGKIEHAYAMTVHKSQGSEYRHVAVLFPDAVTPLVTRQIFYTGITRAKVSVLLHGPESVIRHAVHTPAYRWTGMGGPILRVRREE
jgi:exodeoxyribonuclease V alpha subunit